MTPNQNRIVRASALGGGVGTVVALLMAPQLSLLGLLAGICAGGVVAYLGFDFRMVVVTVKKQLGEFGAGLAEFVGWFPSIVCDAGKELWGVALTPKPFFWITVLAMATAWPAMPILFPGLAASGFAASLTLAGLLVFPTAPAWIPLTLFGLYKRAVVKHNLRIVWWQLGMEEAEVWGVYKRTNYSILYRMSDPGKLLGEEGVFLHNWKTVLMLARMGWTDLAGDTRQVVHQISLKRAAVEVAREIHCHERVLAAFSAIGGSTLAYCLFAGSALTPAATGFACLCGAALGAAISLVAERMLAALTAAAGDNTGVEL